MLVLQNPNSPVLFFLLKVVLHSKTQVPVLHTKLHKDDLKAKLRERGFQNKKHLAGQKDVLCERLFFAMDPGGMIVEAVAATNVAASR